jgi:hypothetical protein
VFYRGSDLCIDHPSWENFGVAVAAAILGGFVWGMDWWVERWLKGGDLKPETDEGEHVLLVWLSGIGWRTSALSRDSSISFRLSSLHEHSCTSSAWDSPHFWSWYLQHWPTSEENLCG